MLSSINSFDLGLMAAFAIASLLYIGTLHVRPYAGDFAIKAIPAISLAVMAWMYIPGIQGKLLVAGFLLSACGDISLAFKGEKFFLSGLVFFLLAHIVYVVTFSLDKPYTFDRWYAMAALAFLAIGMAVLLYPKLGDMKIPVLVYVSVILCMGVFASMRSGMNPWLLIGGATLFMLSDSVIALDRFLKPVPGAQYIIMTTYYAGQFLICRSFIA